MGARGSTHGGGEGDGADGDAEEDGEISVAVLWRGIELDWDTLTVEEPEEEEGPTRAVLGRSFELAERASLSSFALPFWSVVAAPLGSGAVGSDTIRVRDGPPSWSDSSSSGCSRSIVVVVLAGSLIFRRRRSKVQRL